MTSSENTKEGLEELKKASAGKRVFLGLSYVVYLILIFEGGSRIFFSLGTNHQWSPTNNVSTRINWVKRHQDSDADFRYTFDLYDPERGWVTKPNVTDLPVFGDRVLNTNSKGIRGKKEYTYEKPDDTLRILFLGDSFAFGEGVSDHETIAYQLEDRFANLEIINLGVHGYGHDQMLLYLQEEGVKYHPDIIMLGFIGSDMKRNRMKFRDYAKPYFAIGANNQLELRNVPVPPPDEFLASEIYRPKFFDVLSLLWLKIENRMGRLWEKEVRITDALLDEIVAVSKEHGAEPFFVYMPYGFETYTTEPSRLEAYLTAYCEQRQVRMMNLRPAFLEKAESGVDVGRVFHWNEHGHAIAARGIGDYLEEMYALPLSNP